MEKRGKLVIFSAPSGSGKSTIIQSLLNRDLNLSFSISATSRAPRGTEKNGVEYYFISPEEFRQRIANGEFLEYEEVYAGKFYGTLKSEVERILDSGRNVIFDPIKVIITGIDAQGRVDVSHREFLPKPEGYVERPERPHARGNFHKH